MLVEDTAAFIEQLDVPKDDRQADRLRSRVVQADFDVFGARSEARLAADAHEGMLRELARRSESPSADTGGLVRRWRNRSLERETERVQRLLQAKLNELSVKQERLSRAKQEAREHEVHRRMVKMVRLHSAQHYFECSERRFADLASSQFARPVLVTRRDGRRWWWYLDRFWWDDEGLTAREVMAAALESDLTRKLQPDAFVEAQSATLGSEGVPDPQPLHESVRLAVWRRDFGRCVECGSGERLVFDRIIAISHGGSDTVPNIELRCGDCRAQRVRNEARATMSKVRMEAEPRRREPIPDAARHEVWARDSGRCVDCGSERDLELDHIISLAKGGSVTTSNLELRCGACRARRYRRRAWAPESDGPEVPVVEPQEVGLYAGFPVGPNHVAQPPTIADPQAGVESLS